MKLRYTPESLCDLQEIKRYIKSELHNPTAASRITKAILDGCVQLKQFPEMGVSIGAKTGYETDLRMLVVEGYIALYRIETEDRFYWPYHQRPAGLYPHSVGRSYPLPLPMTEVRGFLVQRPKPAQARSYMVSPSG